jgi:hypothetical protein
MMSLWFLAACLPLAYYSAPNLYLVETSGGAADSPLVPMPRAYEREGNSNDYSGKDSRPVKPISVSTVQNKYSHHS